MLYDELQQRYGNHIAKRVQHELSRTEFNTTHVDELSVYLEKRAEKAALDYKLLNDNPLDRGSMRCEVLHRVWREAEGLSYLLSVAEDVSTTVRASLAS